MDMLIKGMEMPKEHPLCIFICPDGRIVSEQHKPMSPVFDFCNATAVALPEHGDLIDRNELPIIGITDYKLESHTVVEFEDVLNAPVIVEATK